MKTNGKLVQCDRCGFQVFLKYVGPKPTDGGMTYHINQVQYEPLDDEWKCVNYKNLCPACHMEYKGLWEAFFRKQETCVEVKT